MRDFRNDLRDIYKDFYEPDADKAPDERRASGDVKPEALSDLKDDFGSPAGTDAGSGKASGAAGTGPESRGGRADPGAEGGAGSREIETEIVTDTEFAARKKAEAAAAEKADEPEKTGMEELNELIGLTTVKHDVEELIGLAKVRKLREEKGMKTVPVSLHLVFSGNPGTGKTTVARILAKLYKEIGILSEGQLVETDRSGLVAGYVGQTAIKTQKKIEEAMGGVLFIDEAYTLNQEGENFGQEAIDTILKAMEDHRDKFIVIVAGYTELMKEFVGSNPGLRSRFNKYFEFPDYTVDELIEIFKMQCGKYQYRLTDEAEEAAEKEIIRLESEKGENFANAREVRNLFEKIITNQAARVSALKDVDEETLTTITIDDLREDPADDETVKTEENDVAAAADDESGGTASADDKTVDDESGGSAPSDDETAAAEGEDTK